MRYNKPLGYGGDKFNLRPDQQWKGREMNRNTTTIIIVVLVAALAVIGYMYYQDQQTATMEISVDENGISVDTN